MSGSAEWVFASDAGLASAEDLGSTSRAGSGPGPGASWGPFRIEAELGRGATARVYRVRIQGQPPLALKVLVDASPRARQRLAREAWLVGQLQHPGIVTLRGAGELGGHPFLLYELVAGARPLSGFWVNLPTAARVALVAEVAAAVGYAHACGVLHRDLKPANVLVDADGRPRVVDFGLATHTEVEALTREGAWLGTPSYMAPEQFESSRGGQTPAVDVWSLGVLLYEALTERLPFHGGSVIQLAQRVLDDPVTPPSRMNPEVLPAVEAVCLRALAKTPDARHADGRAFAQALRDALLTPPTPARRWPWGLVGGVLAVLLGLAWQSFRPPPEPTPASTPAANEDPDAPPFADVSVLDALDSLGPEAVLARAEPWLAEHPDDAKARLALASAHARLKHWARARDEARTVLNDRPRHLLALELLAVSSHGLGDRVAAEEYTDRGLALDPSRPRLWQVKAMLAAYYGKPDDAERAARRALELNPEDPETLGLYALAKSMQGEDETALDYYDRALARADTPDLRFNRATSLLKLRRGREALDDAEFVLRALPDDPDGHCLRVSALSVLDRVAGAKAGDALLQRFPDVARAQHTCGEVYGRAKRYADARAAYRRCLELEPAGQFAAHCRKELERLAPQPPTPSR